MLSFKSFLILAMVVAGGLAAAQAAFNARLSAIIGNPIQASFISFVIGALALGLLLLATRQGLPALGQLTQVPPQFLLGGLFGGVFITCAIFLVPRIGVVNVLFLGLAGQMLVSVGIDNLGLFGLRQQPLTTVKIVGLLLIIAGVAFLKIDTAAQTRFDNTGNDESENMLIQYARFSTSRADQYTTLYSVLPATFSQHGSLQGKRIQVENRRINKQLAKQLRNRFRYTFVTL